MRRLTPLAVALLVQCGRETPAVSPTCIEEGSGFGPAGAVPVRFETVVSGLEVPWGVAFVSPTQWLVTERPGRLRLVEGGALVPELVSIPLAVRAEGEGGLMGIALHPSFAQNRSFYLYYTGTSAGGAGENRIERFRLAPDSRSATSEGVVLAGIPAASRHDGGRLRIGPDGHLYAGTGDAAVPARSRDGASLAGKILRLGPDGAVPADNPRAGSPVFVSGVRNTQGFDWLDDGALVVTDHGPSGEQGRTGHDEIAVARGGDDLGWPDIYSCETKPGLVTPLLTWQRAAPPGGALVYRGTRIPEWQGSVVVGVLGGKHVHRVVFGDEGGTRRVAKHEVYFQGDGPSGLGRVRDVVLGPDGELYVTTSNCDGRGTCPADKDRIARIVR